MYNRGSNRGVLIASVAVDCFVELTYKKPKGLCRALWLHKRKEYQLREKTRNYIYYNHLEFHYKNLSC